MHGRWRAAFQAIPSLLRRERRRRSGCSRVAHLSPRPCIAALAARRASSFRIFSVWAAQRCGVPTLRARGCLSAIHGTCTRLCVRLRGLGGGAAGRRAQRGDAHGEPAEEPARRGDEQQHGHRAVALAQPQVLHGGGHGDERGDSYTERVAREQRQIESGEPERLLSRRQLGHRRRAHRLVGLRAFRLEQQQLGVSQPLRLLRRRRRYVRVALRADAHLRVGRCRLVRAVSTTSLRASL
mmetsp:Transcript_36094/g.75974  ORF Transcript_36094/g.75974 Transcript_36094/m.75974 type:complete len:239 (-) Transcript_36094:736-1452(-)